MYVISIINSTSNFKRLGIQTISLIMSQKNETENKIGIFKK